VALLLHLPASVLPTVAERGGATRVQELAGGAGYDERERTEGREVVWKVAGDGVGLMVCSEGAFYRPERAGAGVSRRWPGRVSGDVQRAKPGVAALGACWRGEVMASGHCGHALASSRRSVACREAEGQGEGSGRVLPLFFHVSRPGSGQGRRGIDRGGVHGYGYRARAYGDGVGHSSLDFTEICPPGVRHNARTNFEFEILKSATVGYQDTSQGFQNYFCSEERSWFAKI
jgi:hypothetical protein